MTDKYLMLELNDARSGKIAEVMANKTCKKILSLIADKELSENDISKELKIPINTVDYNIKNLLDSGLIEKAGHWWSVKGRRIETYKLANKKIIISTKSRTTGLIAGALIFGAFGFAFKVFGNIFSVSKSVYSEGIINVPHENLVEKASSAGTSLASNNNIVYDNATNLISNSNISFSSLFNNVSIWVVVGALIGVLLVISFRYSKKLKGGIK